MTELTLIQPDDWHCHLRDGAYLTHTVPASAKQFGRAIVMPNLTPPVATAQAAGAYQERIRAHIPAGSHFAPLMTLYLTDETSVQIIEEAKASKIIYGCKLYPAGATTNSQAGVTDIKKIYPALEAMSRLGIPLLIHGEVTEPSIDIFDREAVFIEKTLLPLMQQFSELKIVLEHITTKDAVDCVLTHPRLGATITPQHLLLNRNDMLAGGIKPHHYCLPVLKRQTHQEALVKAATSGNPQFFLGTDSAPHAKHKKESACGCAGIYNAFAAIEFYAQVFEEKKCLDKLEGFASRFGADFYGLPYNKGKIRLRKENWQVPLEMDFGKERIVPFMAGKTLSWRAIP